MPFTCTESDLESYFSKYGKLSEVNLPIDKRTNKAIGYAFVTFELPEHGVKAFNELDGSVFQGRMIHLLPSHAKKEDSKSGKDGGKLLSSVLLQWKTAVYNIFIYGLDIQCNNVSAL